MGRDSQEVSIDQSDLERRIFWQIVGLDDEHATRGLSVIRQRLNQYLTAGGKQGDVVFCNGDRILVRSRHVDADDTDGLAGPIGHRVRERMGPWQRRSERQRARVEVWCEACPFGDRGGADEGQGVIVRILIVGERLDEDRLVDTTDVEVGIGLRRQVAGLTDRDGEFALTTGSELIRDCDGQRHRACTVAGVADGDGALFAESNFQAGNRGHCTQEEPVGFGIRPVRQDVDFGFGLGPNLEPGVSALSGCGVLFRPNDPNHGGGSVHRQPVRGLVVEGRGTGGVGGNVESECLAASTVPHRTESRGFHDVGCEDIAIRIRIVGEDVEGHGLAGSDSEVWVIGRDGGSVGLSTFGISNVLADLR